MSIRSFHSVYMTGAVAGAALGCYLVSLRVASERAAIEGVETEIVSTQRDIRMLQTEIGTRGRLGQLEQWNASALALSAPSANQFVEDGFQLARLIKPEPKVTIEAPVVLASAPAPQPHSALEEPVEVAADPGEVGLLHQASFKVAVAPERPAPKPAATRQISKAEAASAKPAATAIKKVIASVQFQKAAAPEPQKKKPAERVAERTLKTPVKFAEADPLAPLPVGHSERTAKPAAAGKDGRGKK
jgi:hypothetical protein